MGDDVDDTIDGEADKLGLLVICCVGFSDVEGEKDKISLTRDGESVVLLESATIISFVSVSLNPVVLDSVELSSGISSPSSTIASGKVSFCSSAMRLGFLLLCIGFRTFRSAVAKTTAVQYIQICRMERSFMFSMQ